MTYPKSVAAATPIARAECNTVTHSVSPQPAPLGLSRQAIDIARAATSAGIPVRIDPADLTGTTGAPGLRFDGRSLLAIGSGPAASTDMGKVLNCTFRTYDVGRIVATEASQLGVRLIPIRFQTNETWTPERIAAALDMPLASLLLAHEDGEITAMAFVVEADSIERALDGASMHPLYQVHDPSRGAERSFPLPGNRVGRWHWSAPAGDDAFRANLTAPAPLSDILALAISGDEHNLYRVLAMRADSLREEEAQTAAQAEQRQRLALAYSPSRLTLATLLANQPLPDLVPNFIPNGGLGIIYGDHSAGKTFAALDIAARLAAGLTITGQPCARHLVIYASGDDDPRDMAVRVAAVQHKYGLTEADPFIALDSVPNLRDPLGREAFEAVVEHYAGQFPGLPIAIFLDTLSITLGPDGDDAIAPHVGAAFGAARAIGRRFDATVSFLHHTTKNGNDYRGHGVIGANANFVVYARGTRSGGIKLTSEKLKSGAKGTTIEGHRVPTAVAIGNGTTAGTLTMEWEAPVSPGHQPAPGSPDTPAAPRPAPARAQHEMALLAAISASTAAIPIRTSDATGHPVEATPLSEVRKRFNEAAQPAHGMAFPRALKALEARGAVELGGDGKSLIRLTEGGQRP